MGTRLIHHLPGNRTTSREDIQKSQGNPLGALSKLMAIENDLVSASFHHLAPGSSYIFSSLLRLSANLWPLASDYTDNREP